MNQTDYHPCFAAIPDSWEGRWAVLREFVRRWHGLTLDPVGRRSPLVAQEESKLGVQLPPSFREYVSFSEELIAQNAFGILRDCYEVTRLQAHSAISLLLQGEGDVYWAVKLEDFSKQDPPVNTYYLEYEKNEFVHRGLDSPSITSSLLSHMAYFLHGKGGGFLVRLNPTEAFLAEMRRAFPVTARFGNLQLFEAENIIAMIMPPNYGVEEHRLLVGVYRPIPKEQIPDCILACIPKRAVPSTAHLRRS
jgi:hypothetical protein